MKCTVRVFQDKVKIMKLLTTRSIGLFLIGVGLFQPTIAQQTNNNVPDRYEFKVMLKNERFISTDEGIKGLQKAIADKTSGSKVIFNVENEPKLRIVTYLDTKKCHLKNNDFILRKRFTLTEDGVPDRMKVTLKFRGSDVDTVGQKVLIAQPSTYLTKSKFEVDVVKGPSSSTPAYKFSRSASIELGKFKKISDLMALYPVLKELETSGHPKIKKTEVKLKRVNKFTAFETVVEVGSIKIAEAKCDASFSFWYKTKEKSKPIAAEFSYVCKKESDEANQLFQTILGLSEWVSLNPKTKTAIAYGDGDGDFCPSQ